jgi:acetyltransferase
VPIFVPPVTIDQLEVAKNIHDSLADTKKTVLACFMGAGGGSEGIGYLKEHDVPVYIYPEAIARTLATIYRYKQRLSRPRGRFKAFDVDTKRVQQIVEKAVTNDQAAIAGEDAVSILQAYGIPAAGYERAASAREAVEVASRIGYPVVMKVSTPPILHKTEIGGVMVDLRTDQEVRAAFRGLQRRVGEVPEGGRFTVAMQQMISGGIETVMGMITDPSFGPLIMFGLGGIYVEVMKDVSFRINPLNDEGAREMIRSLRSYPLLTGFRGAPPVDLDTLVETLLRLSQLVKDFDCFLEIDINPFIASPDRSKCKAVDARLIVKPA